MLAAHGHDDRVVRRWLPAYARGCNCTTAICADITEDAGLELNNEIMRASVASAPKPLEGFGGSSWAQVEGPGTPWKSSGALGRSCNALECLGRPVGRPWTSLEGTETIFDPLGKSWWKLLEGPWEPLDALEDPVKPWKALNRLRHPYALSGGLWKSLNAIGRSWNALDGLGRPLEVLGRIWKSPETASSWKALGSLWTILEGPESTVEPVNKFGSPCQSLE